ncbi:conserved protein [Tepidicaulis marinus]|uniref:Conserved protein n=1 Tax=Tepidicaulis marinus TaxID=1333998 RepID=A0A081B9X0_9HYPH|nr:DUF2065 domain-containing protein [Tepidicaulis marinus]GAK44838.1 conserved protein [Tepidicaulis marinus]
MNDLWAAIGLFLALEGALYAAFPGGVKRMMERAKEMPDATLRFAGLTALGAGFLIVWLVRG